MNSKHPGLEAALNYPLFSAIFKRRERRISRGLKSIPAGSLSYTSDKEPKPLSPLEEALLIAATGTTGVTMPDLPLETEDGKELVGSPLLEIYGRFCFKCSRQYHPGACDRYDQEIHSRYHVSLGPARWLSPQICR